MMNFDAVKWKAIFVFLLVHLGLGIGIVSLARESFPNGWDLTTSLFLASIICLYAGFLLGVLFILIPLLPWLRRAQKVQHWTDRLIHDLPLVLEHLPKIIAAVQSLLAEWREQNKKSRTEP